MPIRILSENVHFQIKSGLVIARAEVLVHRTVPPNHPVAEPMQPVGGEDVSQRLKGMLLPNALLTSSEKSRVMGMEFA